MAQWTCPICGFSAEGSDEEVEQKKREHMEQTQEDPAHQQPTPEGVKEEEES